MGILTGAMLKGMCPIFETAMKQQAGNQFDVTVTFDDKEDAIIIKLKPKV
jgi:hypothetical protein